MTLGILPMLNRTNLSSWSLISKNIITRLGAILSTLKHTMLHPCALLRLTNKLTKNVHGKRMSSLMNVQHINLHTSLLYFTTSQLMDLSFPTLLYGSIPLAKHWDGNLTSHFHLSKVYYHWLSTIPWAILATSMQKNYYSGPKSFLQNFLHG